MARRRLQRAGALRDLSPRKILTQIVLLQLAYYLVAFVLITFTTLVAGQDWGLGLFFDWHSLRGDTTTGWTLGLCWMLSSLVGVIFLLVLINRSKLIPDFALTLHFINLVLTSLYTGGIPTTRLWWALQLASSALMTFLGIWICQRRELAPISFGGGSSSNNTTAVERPKDTPGLHGPSGGLGGSGGKILSFINNLRGTGTSSGDGRGNYEMASMNGDG